MMTLKSEWKWLAAFGVISILAAGCLTNFEFGQLEIISNDPVSSPSVVVYLTGSLYTARSIYLLAALLIARSPLAALMISIINPLAGLLLVITFSMYFTAFLKTDPASAPLRDLILLTGFTSVIIFQTIIEFKALRSLRTFVQSRS